METTTWKDSRVGGKMTDDEKIAQFVDMIGVSPFANEFTGNPELFKKRLFEKIAEIREKPAQKDSKTT